MLREGTTYSYSKYIGKEEVEFLSYKGMQKVYPKNLLVASYHEGKIYLNHEINESNSRSAQYDIKLLISNASSDRIINKKPTNKKFPFRWILK